MWKTATVLSCKIWFLLVLFSGVHHGSDLTSVEKRDGDGREVTAGLPDLYRYDNYGQCLERGSAFCMVRAVVKPKPLSEVWNRIQNVSADVRHYRHNLLDRGVCVAECLRSTKGLSRSQRQELLVEPFTVDFNYHFESKYFPHQSRHRELYGEVVNLCVNQELRTDFALQVFTEIEYCHEPGRRFEPLGTWDGFCIVVICLLAGLAVLSTIFDCRLKKKSTLDDHFGTDPESIEYRIATLWSVPRNIQSLTTPAKSVLSKDFRFLEGIRFITMVTIIQLHTTVMLMHVPTAHPERFEETLQNPVLATLSLFTPNLVQSFFTMGGLLMAVNLLDSLAKNPDSIQSWGKVLWDKVVNRLKRILPVYLFVMLVTATLYRRIQLGPLYDRIVGIEANNCRNNWWVNLLFLNNYVKVNETCVQPSWYLSADFQFYLFGLIALLTIKRYPKTTKYWIGFMVTLNFVGPSLVMWIRQLPPLMATGTRPVLLLFTDDEWFARLYKPFHTSSAGYFYGILAGLVYHRAKPSGESLVRRKTFLAVKLMAIAIVLACYLPASLLYEVNLELPPWTVPIYGAVAKNCWGFLSAVLFIDMALSSTDRLRSLLEHRFLLPLGKLTYSVYHGHFLILMAISSGIRAPLANDALTPFWFTVVALVLSYGLGLVVFLLVEQPVANLLGSKSHYVDYIGGRLLDGARSCLRSINKKLF
ncbi:nose resistant to fluoxetine protein 6 [Culex quinquefasciatus]|uniref:nose resistant to fluoxetine protein 6 n=1 Tax=Culex quinquefasciatus TaxID=7176 RepID=UPI0018E3D223|nr:nose resistant to fluoxetine protein 6 [Culex quinquefasciatus]